MFRRVLPLAPAILATGVLGGGVGAAFVLAMRLGMRLVGPTHLAWPAEAAILVGTGLLVAGGTRLLGPPGSVELLVDNIHVQGGPEGLARLRSLIPLSLLCIMAGSPIGPEAPLVQTCGTLGAWVGRRRRLGARELRVLTLTGMAAAFSVLFGSPAGAAVFALELPDQGGLGYGEALLPAMVGALCGEGVYVALTGLGLAPVWRLPAAGPRSAMELLLALGCGIVAAGGALAFVSLHRLLDAGLGRLPSAARPALAGMAVAALALLSPAALTFGEGQVDGVTVGKVVLSALALAALAKLLAAVVAVAGRWPGGFIIPLFFIGFALGRLAHQVAPGADAAMLMAALAAALCAAVTKTPLGSTLVVTGMTGLALLPTTLLAAVVAVLLSARTVMIPSQRRVPASEVP